MMGVTGSNSGENLGESATCLCIVHYDTTVSGLTLVCVPSATQIYAYEKKIEKIRNGGAFRVGALHAAVADRSKS